MGHYIWWSGPYRSFHFPCICTPNLNISECQLKIESSDLKVNNSGSLSCTSRTLNIHNEIAGSWVRQIQSPRGDWNQYTKWQLKKQLQTIAQVLLLSRQRWLLGSMKWLWWGQLQPEALCKRMDSNTPAPAMTWIYSPHSVFYFKRNRPYIHYVEDFFKQPFRDIFSLSFLKPYLLEITLHGFCSL